MRPSPSALRDEAILWIGPPPTHSNAPPPNELEQMTAIAQKYDVAERDARNRALGRAGEERILAHERASLLAAGRNDLADRIRWVSQADGDGAGYDILSFDPDGSAAFLAHFSTVFTLNYDLLLYWVNLEKQLLRDGFGLGKTNGAFHGPFSEGAHCHVYSLHGGLHLFDNGSGEIMKAIDRGDGVIATITKTIASGRRFPVYVTEGSSSQKMRKINSVAYLRHCYDKLLENPAIMFVYGHSADENDAHIYNAIFRSGAEHLYFGIYQPDAAKLNALDGLLAKYQRTIGSSTKYTLSDSETAKVWDA